MTDTTEQTFVLVSTVDDNIDRTFWWAFPASRRAAAQRLHDEGETTCTCISHRCHRKVIETVTLPVPTDHRVSVYFDDAEVVHVGDDGFTWLDA